MKQQSLIIRFIVPISILIVFAIIGAGLVISIHESRRIQQDADNRTAGLVEQFRRLLEVTDALQMERVRSSMKLLRVLCESMGPPSLGAMVTVKDRQTPDLLFGGNAQANLYELVDGVTEVMGGTATLFVRSGDDFVRISSNVKRDNQRAIATLLDPNGKAIAAIRKGEAFYGLVDILGSPYLTGYEPIFDAQRQVIGIWYVGYEIDLKILQDLVKKSRILQEGFVAILDGSGKARFHSDNVKPEVAEEVARTGSTAQWRAVSQGFDEWGFRIVAAWPAAEATAQAWRTALWILLGGAALGVVLIGIIAALLRRRVIMPLGGEPDEAVALANAIAGGDLSRSLTVQPGHENSLMAAMQRMQESLRTMFAAIEESSRKLTDSATAVAQAAHRAADGSRSQSREVARMSGSIEQVASGIEGVAGHGAAMKEKAGAASAASREGAALVDGIIVQMKNSADSVNRSADLIAELDEQARRISAIVLTIKEIADQTNLLALNAAIEAARAGEQGRGFAVVADEVRKLAERTADSTQEIADMIGNIQSKARTTSEGMASGSRQVNQSVELVTEAGNAMSSIHRSIDEVAATINLIANSLAQQKESTSEIASGIGRVAAATSDTGGTAESMSRAADDLVGLARALRDAVGRFRH